MKPSKYHSFLLICVSLSFCVLGCKDNHEDALAPVGDSAGPTNKTDTPQPTPPAPDPLDPMDYLHTTVKQPQMVRERMTLLSVRQSIEAFFSERGRYPLSLDELNSVYPLPPAPRGKRYEYDPMTGEITLVPGDEE